MPSIAKHNYSVATFNFPRREKCSPTYFSSYKRFFRGTQWELLAVPFDCGSRYDSMIDEAKKKLVPVPAVYELAVSKTPGGKRYKVYLGQTNNMVRRHTEYFDKDNDVKTRNHVRVPLEHALSAGLFVYRRVRYIIPYTNLSPIAATKATLMSYMWETRLLAQYNYAWNSKNNGNDDHQHIDHTRDVHLEKLWGCLPVYRVKFRFNDSNARNLYKI